MQVEEFDPWFQAETRTGQDMCLLVDNDQEAQKGEFV
jgi:hypothetical protein